MSGVRGRPWSVALLGALVGACSDGTGPDAADRLVFDVPPVSVGSGAGFAPVVTVSARDGDGSIVVHWSEPITLALEGGGGSRTLGGTLSVVPTGGVAAFHDLTLTGAAGGGLELVATSGALGPAASEPFALSATFEAGTLTAGAAHTCALDRQGGAWCWGGNASGQLGDGTTVDRPLPTRVGGGRAFTALAAEGKHTCGLVSGGDVYCWGANDVGQLGNGTRDGVALPRRVSLPEAAVRVDPGYWHTCALGESGTAYCWGYNVTGMLGTGSAEQYVATPQAVPGMRFASLSAGYQHVCGLTPEGAAYCWGLNVYGEVGAGARLEEQPVPVEVEGDHRFAYLRAGGGPCHGETCGITVGGETYCWGKNHQPTLGPVGGGWASAPAAVAGAAAFVEVIPGPLTVCGLTAGGGLHCWGDPQNGELANGSRLPVEAPTPVLGGKAVRSVAMGSSHVCAATVDGGVWCWGRNDDGQLGNGSNPAGWLFPVPVWDPGG